MAKLCDFFLIGRPYRLIVYFVGLMVLKVIDLTEANLDEKGG